MEFKVVEAVRQAHRNLLIIVVADAGAGRIKHPAVSHLEHASDKLGVLKASASRIGQCCRHE